jgi:hypothetical protein
MSSPGSGKRLTKGERKVMARTVAVIAMVAVFLLSASDVRGGAGGLVQPAKTTGPAVNFTVVTVVNDTSAASTKGQTTLRVQKSNQFDGALFTSGYVQAFTSVCILSGSSLQGSTALRFVGFMDLWVPFDVRAQLLGKLGDPNKAAVTDVNDAACSTVNGVTSLSFTGTIQFGS